MTFREFLEEYRGVRRTIMVVCIIWVSVTIGIGLWVLVMRPLTGPDTAFLTAVVALMNAPVALYFKYRGGA